MTFPRICLALGFLLLSIQAGWAQAYPSRLIRIIVPFPAGGLADTFARAVADEMGKSLGQNILIENRPGAGGNIGAAAVASAEPDGYTLMLSSAGILTTNEFLYESMPFDTAKAFAPITVLADMPMLLVVHPKLNVTTVSELLVLARSQPGTLNFGSAGVGTTGHLALARFGASQKIKVQHIPYRGAAPSVQDLVGGRLDGLFDNPPTVLSHIEAKAIRALAVTAPERLPQLPDVPTMAESGVNFEASSWFALIAPAGTPRPVIELLHAEAVKALGKPALQSRFSAQGARLVGNTPEMFAAQIASERELWGKVIRDANIRAQ